MLNDCWPAAIGWSIIDYYAMPKPGYYSFKRCAKPMVASIENKDGKLIAHISNDRYEGCEGKGSLYLYDFKKNEKILEKTFDFSLGENIAEKVFECDYKEFEKLLTKDNIIILDASSNLGTDRTFYVKDGLVKILKMDSITRGIVVKMVNNKLVLDFHVIVAYGVSISAVSDNLISNVKYKVEEFTGVEVSKVNVFVEGVRAID